MTKKHQMTHPARLALLLIFMGVAVLILSWRVIDLQVFKRSFLQNQGNARHLRVINIPAHRGMIVDRNGEALAISTPVDSVWANPRELLRHKKKLGQLAKALNMSTRQLRNRLIKRIDREFVYLKRHVDPGISQKILALELPGVSLQREYGRYYPAGEVAAHVVGFTNIDDVGQEGIELAYDEWLRGDAGSKWVLKDRLGHSVEDVENIQSPRAGRSLQLSIDHRLQYLAYRELKTAVQLHHAKSGSVVLLDIKTGEVLAMVNQPSYNPNNRKSLRSDNYRNRAVTDVFEPGSTIKPFTVSSALSEKVLKANSLIDTSPGFYQIGDSTISDPSNYGVIDVTTVIQKSSNVGASKIALTLKPETLWRLFANVGFGSHTGGGFPGEVTGLLADYWDWNRIEQATLSYGYGLSVTPLQLARAYTVFADRGRIKSVSFLTIEKAEDREQVLDAEVAEVVLSMMKSVVSDKGTGKLAQVTGFQVAGKTGTIQKVMNDGYSDERYVAVFAGIAPASNPRFAMVVKIDEPDSEEYYGGRVAAPVFSKIMAGSLRIIGVIPDDIHSLKLSQKRRVSVENQSLIDKRRIVGQTNEDDSV